MIKYRDFETDNPDWDFSGHNFDDALKKCNDWLSQHMVKVINVESQKRRFTSSPDLETVRLFYIGEVDD